MRADLVLGAAATPVFVQNIGEGFGQEHGSQRTVAGQVKEHCGIGMQQLLAHMDRPIFLPIGGGPITMNTAVSLEPGGLGGPGRASLQSHTSPSLEHESALAMQHAGPPPFVQGYPRRMLQQ